MSFRTISLFRSHLITAPCPNILNSLGSNVQAIFNPISNINLMHTIAKVCLPDKLLTTSQSLPFHQRRYEHDGVDKKKHWSEGFEQDEMNKKKRFSNEGFYFQSVFTRQTADHIWKGVAGESKASKKSGRGKRGGKMRRVDLNKGQVIGQGVQPMKYPGLNTKVEKDAKILKLPESPEWKEKLLAQRQERTRPRRMRQSPLERGWTSAKFGGRKIGPPEPIGDQTFEDFETWILEFKRVSHMSATVGRAFSYTCLVVVGNGRGLAGFALGKGSLGSIAQRKAKSKAIQRLQYVNLYNNHTIFHKIYSKFHGSHLFIEPRPEGHGIRAHRAIKVICEAIGIKDLWGTSENNSSNNLAITKGFFKALRAQKDFQQMADETCLHVVEYRGDCDNFPRLVTSPRPEVGPVRKDADIGTQEYRDLDLILNDGMITEFRPIPKPPYVYNNYRYMNFDRWREYKRRNQDSSKLKRHILFSDKYPEVLVINLDKKEEEVD